MPLVNFVSRQAAEVFSPGRGGFRHLISISDPEIAPVLNPGWDGVLRLRFHDLDELPVGRSFARLPEEGDCSLILAFGKETLKAGVNLLVHCEAGASRSAAAALALEAVGFELPNRSRAYAANRRMVELFSRLLGQEIVVPEEPARSLWG